MFICVENIDLWKGPYFLKWKLQQLITRRRSVVRLLSVHTWTWRTPITSCRWTVALENINATFYSHAFLLLFLFYFEISLSVLPNNPTDIPGATCFLIVNGLWGKLELMECHDACTLGGTVCFPGERGSLHKIVLHLASHMVYQHVPCLHCI